MSDLQMLADRLFTAIEAMICASGRNTTPKKLEWKR
jgi:hypothetical protein